jgi:putative flippase GtrA
MEDMTRTAIDGAGTSAAAAVSSMRRSMIREFVTFAGVGVIGTAVHYLALVALVQGFGVAPIPASVVGFILGAFTNYVLNYRITFLSTKKHSEAMMKFYLVALAGLTLNTLVMAFAIRWLAFHYLLAQASATAVTLMFNFCGNRYWTFR